MRSHSFIGTCLALVLCVIPPGAMAQSEGASAAPSAGASNPIAIIDQDRLLSASRYGQRMGQEIEAAGAALVAENRRIEGQLTEEELRLTAQRANMDADAFRPLAEEFDARVESIRAAQEAKSRALQAQAEAARAAFAGGDAQAIPEAIRADPQRFPFGRFRRILMPPLYASLKLADL